MNFSRTRSRDSFHRGGQGPGAVRRRRYSDLVLIRDAATRDAYGIARVHVDAWRKAYLGLIPQDVLDNLAIDERAEQWQRIIADPAPGARTLVADEGGDILGWASFGGARDDDPPASGELWGIYAHPDAWSTGVGRKLLAAVEDGLRAAGHRSAYLWVLEGNERATRFYERHEWIGDGAIKLDERPGMLLRERRHVTHLTS